METGDSISLTLLLGGLGSCLASWNFGTFTILTLLLSSTKVYTKIMICHVLHVRFLPTYFFGMHLKIHRENFHGTAKSTKFAKVFFLESFPLHGI